MDDPSVDECVQTFRGKCFGVGLKPRNSSEEDNHVMFCTIVEDDGYWFVSRSSTGSSFWLPELVDCYQQALVWVKENCVPDPQGYGWDFPSDKGDRDG
jgi:hypothetical protein